jgi:hypothetical protein
MNFMTKKPIWIPIFLTWIVFLGSCSPNEPVIPTRTPAPDPTPTANGEIGQEFFADVLAVSVSGNAQTYSFSVEIRSPDTGCEQYADWWEVISEDGELIYRRILAHSHVTEQPFTRSGGPVTIDPETIVIVRAHMYPDGYGGAAWRGSVQDGFQEIQLNPDFAIDLLNQDPLPGNCGF